MKTVVGNEVIALAARYGLQAQLKADGSDQSSKLMAFSHPKAKYELYVHKDVGAHGNGEQKFFKVAVHPNRFVDPGAWCVEGLAAYINRRLGLNLHFHSGYRGFPHTDDGNEPCGKAYRAATLAALAELFHRLAGDAPTRTPPQSAFTCEKEDDVSESTVTANVGAQLGADAYAEDRPRKGLVIDRHWMRLILLGDKTWEMRSRNCRFRGKIGLIAKGTGLIVGGAEMVDCHGPLSPEDLRQSRDYHRITDSVLPDDKWMHKWRYAWILNNVHAFEKPVPYQHPNGAVIWVDLDACGAWA